MALLVIGPFWNVSLGKDIWRWLTATMDLLSIGSRQMVDSVRFGLDRRKHRNANKKKKKKEKLNFLLPPVTYLLYHDPSTAPS